MNRTLIDAQTFIGRKNVAHADQKEVCKHLSKSTSIPMPDLYKYKDMVYYKGRGWANNNSIEPPVQGEDFKDRVSPCFRRLYEIVSILKSVNDLELLDKYLSDMRAVGIDIRIDPDGVNVGIDKETVSEGVKSMCDLQKIICENADTVRDMGESAEEEGLCPKGRFKGLAEDYYKIQQGKDLEDKLHDVIANNLSHNHGVQVILGIEQTAVEEDDDGVKE